MANNNDKKVLNVTVLQSFIMLYLLWLLLIRWQITVM